MGKRIFKSILGGNVKMKDNITYGACATVMTICGVTQANELFQLIQIIVGVVSGLFAIAYTIYKWYNKAKADGKITSQEIKELGEDISNVLKDKEEK